MNNSMVETLLDPFLAIDVALSSWPEITLQVSEHFYVIFWFAILFLVIILFNLAVITTGALVYGIMIWAKSLKSGKTNPSTQYIPKSLHTKLFPNKQE